jgi:hypothetical protein
VLDIAPSEGAERRGRWSPQPSHTAGGNRSPHRDYPSPLDRLAKERFGTRRVAVLTQQDINDYAILVDSSVQVALLALAEEKHLVHEPTPADPSTVTSHFGRQLWSERLDPVEDGAARDIDAALRQQLKHLAAGQRGRPGTSAPP